MYNLKNHLHLSLLFSSRISPGKYLGQRGWGLGCPDGISQVMSVSHISQSVKSKKASQPVTQPPGGVLPYMHYIGMCCCEGYDFQAVHSSIGYINQSIWDKNRPSFFTKLTSWLKILSTLMKPGIATKKYKQLKSASLNFHGSASTALIHDYHKTLLDIINCLG